VAFTRAEDRLYVPLLPKKKEKEEKSIGNVDGEASSPTPSGQSKYGPLGTFAADALDAVAKVPGQTLIHRDDDPVHIENAPPRRPESVTPDGGRNVRDITPEETAAAFNRIRRLNSYSGLAKRAIEKPHAADLLNEDGKRTVRDEVALMEAAADVLANVPEVVVTPGLSDPPHSTHRPVTREELPAGSAAGNALHGLLELTDFVSVQQAGSPAEWLEKPGRRDQVESLLRAEGLDPSCAPAAACAVWNTLRMEIPDPARPGATFRLMDNADHLHEVEFLFPLASETSMKMPEGTERRGDFLWGFIDLVFRHEGRYYLLDWKSNLLDNYDRETVEAAMLKSGYDLQWQLYAVALHRWLKSRLSGHYDPERDFGGVLYLYLRGAAPDRFSGFTRRPTDKELCEEYPDRLANLVGTETWTERRGGAA
jgi:ATP-dependent exoDNAse (exonuclease V) beta subunit